MLINFAQIVKDMPDELFDTEFVRYVLDRNWTAIRYNTLKFRVVPSVLLTLFANWFFYATLMRPSIQVALEQSALKIYTLGAICFILEAYYLTLTLIS